MIPGLEEMLLSHARQNGFSSVTVGVMMVGERVCYTARVHYQDQPCNSGIPCSSGIADSVSAAMGEAMDDADKDRAVVSSFDLADAVALTFTPVAPVFPLTVSHLPRSVA